MRAVTQVNLIEPRYEVDGGQPLVYGEAITGLPGSGIGKESEKADRTIRGCSRAARVLREHMNLGDPDSGAWRAHWFKEEQAIRKSEMPIVVLIRGTT